MMVHKHTHAEGRELRGRLETLHSLGFKLTLNHDAHTFRVVFGKKCSHASRERAQALADKFVEKGYDNLS